MKKKGVIIGAIVGSVLLLSLIIGLSLGLKDSKHSSANVSTHSVVTTSNVVRGSVNSSNSSVSQSIIVH